MAVSRLLACVAASCAIHASIIATASLAGALPHRRGSGELVARLALAEAPAAARRVAAPEPAPPAPPAAAQPSELP
ncbi:MAG: hypothetical protein HY778_06240, partial [Betaproteobacteria bacterium]|nr:hypothetical protein [Betaproteobacteria bacterium]